MVQKINREKQVAIQREQVKHLEREKRKDKPHGNTFGIDTTIGFRGPAAKTCQWIAGAPTRDDSCKCGKPAMFGIAYCEFHQGKVYGKTYTKTSKVVLPVHRR